MKKIIWIVIASLVLIGLIVWIKMKDKTLIVGEPIKIGAILSQSGNAALHGENERRGIELAVKEINNQGGVLGRKLEIIFENDETNPAKSATAAHKLIDVDHVGAIVGGTWDFLANAIIPIIDTGKTVLISPSALKDTLNTDSSYFFMTFSPVSNYEEAFRSFLSRFENKRIVTITGNYPWGLAHTATLKKAIEGSSNKIIGDVPIPSYDQNDMQRAMTLVKSYNPDIIFTALGIADATVLANKRKALGINALILGSYQFIDGFTAGDIRESEMKDIVTFTTSNPEQDFASRYRAEYSEDPKYYADSAYDAVYVIKQAIENSKGKTDGDSIKTGLKQIENYQGASGLIDFSNNNYASNKTPILNEVKDGKIIEVK